MRLVFIIFLAFLAAIAGTIVAALVAHPDDGLSGPAILLSGTAVGLLASVIGGIAAVRTLAPKALRIAAIVALALAIVAGLWIASRLTITVEAASLAPSS